MADETTGEVTTMVDLDALTRPFEQGALKSRPGGGGKTLTYVDGTTVIHRLIEATGNNYSFSVDRYWSQDGCRLALVTLTLPGLGSRSHIGVQAEQAGQGEDALAKGAITDGLKKASTLFGVGLELYGPDLNALEPGQYAPNGNQAQAQRMTSIAQGPQRDPGQIAGVTRGVQATQRPASAPTPQQQRPRPAPVNATQSPASTQPYPYAEIFDGGTRMDAINQYLGECGLPNNGNMGVAIRTVNDYGKRVHGQDNIVVGTGDWNEQYQRYDIRPRDIGNALAHWVGQESTEGTDEMKAAMDRDAAPGEPDDWDDVPF